MLIDDSEFDNERPKTPRWFQRVVRAVAWTIIVTGYLIMALLAGVVLLVMSVNFWQQRHQLAQGAPWAIGVLLALIALAAIWTWAKDYVERL